MAGATASSAAARHTLTASQLILFTPRNRSHPAAIMTLLWLLFFFFLLASLLRGGVDGGLVAYGRLLLIDWILTDDWGVPLYFGNRNMSLQVERMFQFQVTPAYSAGGAQFCCHQVVLCECLGLTPAASSCSWIRYGLTCWFLEFAT